MFHLFISLMMYCFDIQFTLEGLKNVTVCHSTTQTMKKKVYIIAASADSEASARSVV